MRCPPGQACQRRLPRRRDGGPKTKRGEERPRPAACRAKAPGENEKGGVPAEAMGRGKRGCVLIIRVRRHHRKAGRSRGTTGKGSTGQRDRKGRRRPSSGLFYNEVEGIHGDGAGRLKGETRRPEGSGQG